MSFIFKRSRPITGNLYLSAIDRRFERQVVEFYGRSIKKFKYIMTEYSSVACGN